MSPGLPLPPKLVNLTFDLEMSKVTLTFDLGQDVSRRINWMVSEDLNVKSYIVLYYDLITNPDWFLLELGDAVTTNPHRLNSHQVRPRLSLWYSLTSISVVPRSVC